MEGKMVLRSFRFVLNLRKPFFLHLATAVLFKRFAFFILTRSMGVKKNLSLFSLAVKIV